MAKACPKEVVNLLDSSAWTCSDIFHPIHSDNGGMHSTIRLAGRLAIR